MGTGLRREKECRGRVADVDRWSGGMEALDEGFEDGVEETEGGNK